MPFPVLFSYLLGCLALNLFWPSRVPHAPLAQYQCTIIKLRQETPYATIENYRNMSIVHYRDYSKASKTKLVQIHVSRMMSLRILISQTIARFTSATCCRLQSASRPNCCPTHISYMRLLAECVSGKLLPDQRQPHVVIRRVCPAKPLPR